MKDVRGFEKGYDEGYNQGYKKGYIAGVEDTEDELLKPDDFCPKTTPISEIMEIPCMNCAVEDVCDFNKASKVVSGEDFWGEEDLCPECDEDFDDDDYTIEALYDTTKIERFQAVIEEVSMISAHIRYIRSKYFQDEDSVGVLDRMRESVGSTIKALRELQEEAAIQEMYEFLVKNY